MMMSRVFCTFSLLLSLSFFSSLVESQPAGSLALVCRTGNNFISYYGYTAPNTPKLFVGFKHDETKYNPYKSGTLGAGNCTFTSRALASYEPRWLHYSVNAADPQDFEVAVTNIRLPRTVNQVMFIGGDAGARAMFSLGTTTGNLIGLYVVPIAQPVNYAYKVVGTFTPSTILKDHIDPLPITISRPRITSTDYTDLSQEQIEAEQARALYEAGVAETASASSSSSSSSNNNNNGVYIAIGSAIGVVVLGMILIIIAIIVRSRRHSQKHVTPIEMTNTEHQPQPQSTTNPVVVPINQL